MPDLLTHVLVVYIALTVVSWYSEALRPFVSVGMVGAVIPDIAKIRLFVSETTVESLLGLPFSWLPIHRLGGAVVISGIAATFFIREIRLRAFSALLFGAGTALLLDAGVKRANGITPPYFYPFSWWQPPSANLYLSSDPWPALLTLIVAVAVWIYDR